MEAAEQWQRLSPWALVFIVVNGLIKTVRQNISVFLGAGAGFAFIGKLGMRELGLAALALLLIAIVAAMIYHRRFRFRLEDDAIRIRSGLLLQKELRIRFARVLNVNLSQPFYLRPLGLMRFSLDTAGAKQKEVELPGISSALAEQLRDRIAVVRENSEEAAEIAADPSANTVLYQARGRDLLLHGLASNQLWVIVGTFFGLIGFFEQRLGSWDFFDRAGGRLVDVFGGPVLAIAGFAAGFIVAVAMLSMLISWVRFGGYRLELAEDGNGGLRLLSRAGLLDRKERTLPVDKLHAFELVQTAIGRLLGRWYLVGRQAGTQNVGQTARDEQFLVPGLNGETARALLPLIASEQLASEQGGELFPEMQPILPLFKRVMAWRTVLLVALNAGILAVGLWLGDGAVRLMGTDQLISPWLLGALVCLCALAIIWQRWRRWGHACLDGRAWIRHGLIGQRITTFALDRVQQVQLRQSPAQHRNQAVNLVLVLPHGPVTVPFLSLESARPLVNEVLYRVETARVHRI